MTRHLYVVDDDESVRLSLQFLLASDRRNAIRIYASGDEFLDDLAGLEPGVLLLDMHMRGADGLEVLDSLAVAHAPIVTLIMTGQADQELRLASEKAGAIAFLEKPFDHRELFAVIDSGFQRLAGPAEPIDPA